MKDTDWCGSNTGKTVIGAFVGGVDQGLCLVIGALVGGVDQGLCGGDRGFGGRCGSRYACNNPQCSSKYSIWKLNLLPLPVCSGLIEHQ